jgi:uncharacterized RDD family membrane protein YckC
VGPDGSPLAEPWKRIVALLLDGIGLYIIIGIPTAVVIGGGVSTTSTVGDDLLQSFIAGVVTTVIYFLYYSLMIGYTGKTVAGMILSIKVIADTGQPVTPAHGFKRSAWTLLGIVTCIGALAQLVLVIWGLVNLFNDPLRQTPWDKFGETVVVEG